MPRANTMSESVMGSLEMIAEVNQKPGEFGQQKDEDIYNQKKKEAANKTAETK